MANSFYRELEHTGDLAIEVTAPTREQLFANAIIALSRLMVDADGTRRIKRRDLAVASGADADTMRDLLAAALNVFLIDGFIWRDAEVTLSGKTMVASLTGEQFDPKRHQLIEELKAVTYHRLSVEQTSSGWRAIIVFDV
jgi:SHS2 domain-containing protein